MPSCPPRCVIIFSHWGLHNDFFLLLLYSMLNALYDYHFHKSAAAENLLQAKQTNNNRSRNTRQRTPAFLLLDSTGPGCWKPPVFGSSAPSRQICTAVVLQRCGLRLWNATWKRLHISILSCLFQNIEVYGGFLGGYPPYLSNLEADHTQSPIITLTN